MSKVELKNPGNTFPTHLEFTEWPHLAEFLNGGGVPGVEYLYLLPEELPHSQDTGWSTIIRMPFFKVNGISLTAVAKGEPIKGASIGSTICKLNISKLAIERCKVNAENTVISTNTLNTIIEKSKSKASVVDKIIPSA